ncbi:MAG: DUF1553 domain-containing protein [Planctomycetes bacterium]|nr:DUF1553 domain-containing protein [Planctomycetota bacterium]
MTKAAGVSVFVAAALVAFGNSAWGAEASHYNFENDILPILSRFGCNTSGCHGKAEGQNGFKLSIFGFDPEADHAALTQEGRGRRVVSTVPERSLLLAKASGRVPHGGGVRIFRGTDEYRTLADWIAAGCPFGSTSDPRVVAIEVTPRERELKFGEKQPLRVTAVYSDGRCVDVTRHSRFQSNSEGLAQVDDAGVVTTGQSPGDVAIMASYLGEVDVFRALIPRPERIENYPVLPESNFIDGLVYAKLRKLNELPSPPVSDADFLRRVYLDIIGTLPAAREAREFLGDTDPGRRGRLVERLLERPEFADFWALKWSDVLRVDRQVLGHKAAYAYYRWIRDSLAANVPYDQFCRQIVAAEGPLSENPAGHFFKVVSKPGEMGGALSQVFLGVRIDCAQCHHHPFDRWSQSDYLGMQAFFTQVSFKSVAGNEFLLAGNSAPTKHPRTGQNVFAHALATEAPQAEPVGDRRHLLAAWMTAPDNPWFARNLVNRTWAHFLGRGLVEPVDDVRLSNPPTNPALLDALAQSFVQSRFDFKQLIRTITASRVYQTSATIDVTNARDDQNYARALLRSIEAEVLLDAVCQVTGVPEKFQGVPGGTRAIQLWDSQTTHYFLKLFGRPTRTTACECERTREPSVAQVLHILNSTDLHGKLVHAGGRIARLTAALTDDAQLVEELYLTFYSRFPTAAERDMAVAYLQKHQASRRQAVEDLAWSMLNTGEFVFNH